MRPTSGPIAHHPTLQAAQRAAFQALYRGNPRDVQFLTCPQVAHWRQLVGPEEWWRWATEAERDSEARFTVLLEGHALQTASLSPESLERGLLALAVRGHPRALGWVLNKSPWSPRFTSQHWVAMVAGIMERSRPDNPCLAVLEKWVPRRHAGGKDDERERQAGLTVALERLLKNRLISESHLDWLLNQGVSATAPLPSGDAPLVALMTQVKWCPSTWRLIDRLRIAGASLSDQGADGRTAEACAVAVLNEIPNNSYGALMRARWAQLLADHWKATWAPASGARDTGIRPRM